MPARPGDVFVLYGEEPEIAIQGKSPEEILYHLELLGEAGLIKSPGSQPMLGITFGGLTWNGHDFVDSVRDPKIWHDTKEGAHKVGGFSVDLLIALAKGLIKKKIEDLTGIQMTL